MPKKYNAAKQKQYKSANYQKRRKELLRDQPLCHWCKRRPATEADHLIEVDAGGSEGPLVPACKPCNATRGANYKAKKNLRKKNQQTKIQREKKLKPFFDTPPVSLHPLKNKKLRFTIPGALCLEQ